MPDIRYREQYRHRMEQASQYIQDNLSQPLCLDAVARAAGFSPFHFHRIFTAFVGENLQDYINRLRLERAANLLVKSPSLTITEVAFSCGFSSSSAFARSFRKYFGVTPSQYLSEYLNPKTPAAWVTQRPAPAETVELPSIQVRPMPPMHLVCFPAVEGYAPHSIKQAWERLFHWAGARGLLDGRAQLIAVSYDDPQITPPKKCRYYACMTVPETLRSDAQVSFLDFPAHTCAVCRMDCDADQIQPVYRVLYRDWLPDSGFLLADLPPYEIYYNAPDNDPASKYVFDLCIPVEKFNLL
jgi:AraC family transcriptional regulator